MSIIIAGQTPERVSLPKTSFGKELTKKVYVRYHALKSRAAKKGHRFTFESFVDFLNEIDMQSNGLFHPDTHRFSFDPDTTNEKGERLGYSPDTLSIKLVKARLNGSKATKPTKQTAEVLTEDQKLRFMGELTMLIFHGKDMPLEDLISQAKLKANIGA